MKLCKRGYASAKKTGTYPSAWSNTYGSRVCRGIEPDLNGEVYTGDTRPSGRIPHSPSRWSKVNQIIDRRRISQKERAECEDCVLNKKTGKYVFRDTKKGFDVQGL